MPRHDVFLVAQGAVALLPVLAVGRDLRAPAIRKKKKKRQEKN
jgi:hypothetical protein